MRFDVWGKRQRPDWSDGSLEGDDATLVDTLTHGYTGHEHLDDLGLIHMNGRVYDPSIGRFMSPDLFVSSPHNGQSFNRYSYVLNNPLRYTDPSGYVPLNIPEEVIVIGSRQPSHAVNNFFSFVQINLFDDVGGGYTTFTIDLEQVTLGVAQEGGGSCSAPLACAGASMGFVGSAANLTGGTAGVTSKGSFRYYSNNWRGNGSIKTYDLAKGGKALGAAGFGLSLLSDASQLSKGEISGGKFAFNAGIGVLGFTSLWPLSVGYGMTESFGPQVGGAAMDMLIRGQESGIRDSMTFQSYNP